ncbi:MAG: NAD(P)/FAD-dependent oxidoreductase [Beijerinckiaceae bacterium]
MRSDVIVLGAGIVGVAAALHLQKRGRSVTLVDLRGPGEETSYGNAGLIQREAFLPYAFPSGLGKLIRYALNGETEAHYQLSSLVSIAPALFKYWLNSSPERIERTVRTNRPLFENCLSEHQSLAAEAGITDLMRPGGWIQVHRKDETLNGTLKDVQRLRDEFGVNADLLDPASLAALEPHLSVEHAAGAIHWKDPLSLRDPLALTQGYADLFQRRGGTFLKADARTLSQSGEDWQVQRDLQGEGGPVTAREAVVALGPWANLVYEPLGYKIPMFVKRGYHMHYKAKGNATLSRPVIDTDTGFALASMTKGVRMTTGAEFAHRDAPATPVQVDRCEPKAKELFPLESRAEATPWLGRRPAMPDMSPVIGPAPRHKGLWFVFGHAHHGLTNAAVSGRLLAEMMTGETPFCDVSGFRADRAFV